MDTPHDGNRRPTPRRLGFVGRTKLSNAEQAHIRYIARCAARLGHTVLAIPSKGVAAQVEEGVKMEGGGFEALDSKVIDQADTTFVYPDKRLLSRLRTAYPNLDVMPTVIVITPEELEIWSQAFSATLIEYDIPLPT